MPRAVRKMNEIMHLKFFFLLNWEAPYKYEGITNKYMNKQ